MCDRARNIDLFEVNRILWKETISFIFDPERHLLLSLQTADISPVLLY
jgi:hypothetical protein